MSSTKVTVKVDSKLCIAAASCVNVAPKFFDLDEDNVAFLIDPCEWGGEDFHHVRGDTGRTGGVEGSGRELPNVGDIAVEVEFRFAAFKLSRGDLMFGSDDARIRMAKAEAI